MNGPRHYAEAEALLQLANKNDRAIAAAQVHATLALAAATARDALVGDDGDDWRGVLA